MTDNLTSKDGVTLDDLRRAADAVPSKPQGEFAFFKLGEEAHFHRARAEFWRLAFRWEHQQNFAPYDIEDEYLAGHAIIAEVESRT